jgi:hypothetical protein
VDTRGPFGDVDDIFREYAQASTRRRRALLEKHVALLGSLRTEIPKSWTIAEHRVMRVEP